MDSIFTDTSVMSNKIRKYARSSALSHALILSGEGDKVNYAKLLAASYLCCSENRPCGMCMDCQKVSKEIHPDVIVVKDDEHKELSAECIRSVRNDAFIRPNEGCAKVFVFPDCSRLNERDQNILLKIVEEGPVYARFIFCTDSVQVLLPTLRSRCVELKTVSETVYVSSAFLPAFIDALCSRKNTLITEYLVSLENKRMKREDLQMLFSSLWETVVNAMLIKLDTTHDESLLFSQKLASCFSLTELNQMESVFKTLCGECSWNVGTSHVLGATIANLEEIIR